MRVFLDKNFADDNKEIFTDGFNYKEIDDVIYEVEGKTVTERFDSSSVNTGANASAEEATEDVQEGSTRGPDFLIASRLNKLETPFDKKTFVKYLKTYLNAVEFPKDSQDELKAKLQAYLSKHVLTKKFADFEQYTAEGLYPDLTVKPYPMICLLNYREDTDAPYMVVIKHGCLEQKL